MTNGSFCLPYSAPELEYWIRKLNPTHSRIFLILKGLVIMYVTLLDFIWPNCCLARQEPKVSFRKMRIKERCKRIILSQPAYDAKEGDCSCSPPPSRFQQPCWQICPVCLFVCLWVWFFPLSFLIILIWHQQTSYISAGFSWPVATHSHWSL